eukprot:symbB.v1.2.039110.t1/scaffold6354.1/size18795/2
MLALQWLRRLALRSAPLWEACAQVVELGLKEKAFVRDHFADAVHCLASVAAGRSEAALLSKMILAAEVQHAAPRQTAEKTLLVLHAASMMELQDSILASWGSQAARLARQMSLPDRRTLRMISDAGPKASEQLTATMAKMHEPQEEHGKTGTLMDIGYGKSWKRMFGIEKQRAAMVTPFPDKLRIHAIS